MPTEFDNPGYNFSKFQKQFIADMEDTAEFKHWVHAKLRTEVRSQGWSCFLWFTDDGDLHSRRVGVNRFLSDEFCATNEKVI